MAIPARSDDAYLVRLSQEEIWALLHEMSAEEIIGLSTSHFDVMDEKYRQIVLTTARNTLYARDIIRSDSNGEITASEDILSMLNICLNPQIMLLVYHWETRQDIPAFLCAYRVGNRNVVRTESQAGIHEFAVVDSLADLCAVVLRFCQINSNDPASTGELPLDISVPLSLFNTLREQFESGETDLSLNLAEVAVDPQIFRRSMTALSPEAGARASVIRILSSTSTDASLEQIELSITQDSDILLTLSVDEATESVPLVTIRSTTPLDLTAWLRQNLNGTSAR